MNLVFFDLGVFLYWSEESIVSKSLASKGGVIVSNKEDLRALKEKHAVLDPEIIDMLKALKSSGFSLCVCDNLPQTQIKECLNKLEIIDYFDAFVSARTEDTMAKALNKKRATGDFAVYVGSEEKIIRAASKVRIPSIAYGQEWASVCPLAFSSALSPMEIEEQVRITFLIFNIVEKTIDKKSRVLGIDGITFAGKKVLADKISHYMDFVGQENIIVDLEDYHRAVEESYKGEDPVEAYYFNGYNNEKLIDEVLHPYRKQGKIDKTVYCLDISNDSFVNERHYTLSEDGVMILLGTMMYREPLMRYFDTTVYIRVDYREAEHRVSLFHAPIYGDDPLEEYKEKTIPAQKMYVARHNPFENKDFIIDNTNYHRPFFIV